MPAVLFALEVAALSAILLTLVVSAALGEALQSRVNQVFLALKRMHGMFGTSRMMLSRRESLLLVWFLAFVLSLVVCAMFPEQVDEFRAAF